MAGSHDQGMKAAETNRERYGKDYYQRLSAKSHQYPRNKPQGFAAVPGLASAAGRKGGAAPRGSATAVAEAPGEEQPGPVHQFGTGELTATVNALERAAERNGFPRYARDPRD